MFYSGFFGGIIGTVQNHLFSIARDVPRNRPSKGTFSVRCRALSKKPPAE
jgi:hypothetical protein